MSVRPAAVKWTLIVFVLPFALATAANDRPADQLPEPAKQDVDFARDVQPILQAHCVSCHGPKKQESGLRLDLKQRAMQGGDSGAAILAGKSADSPLIHRVAGVDPDLIMPPEGEPLTKQQVALLRAWIDQGAKWPETANAAAGTESTHWAYQSHERPEVPKIDDEWIHRPIDAFVLSQLKEVDVKPSPEADRHTLIRRLSLDLLGLPPTPEEVDAFLNNQSPNAYGELVDRLLRSPHFGERWGRHWLDKARYADSDGYEKDRPRPNAWRWRDWVIQAINDDMPFDQFTIEQLAGDLLPDADVDEKLATAFHRQTLTNTEGGTDQEQFRVEAVFDRVETTGTVWLGLTVGCARCHSHKYDQITQREFYQLFAFFNNGDEVTTDVPISDEAVRAYEVANAKHGEQVQAIQTRLNEAKKDLGPALAKWEDARKSSPIEWTVADNQEVKSKAGVKFTRQSDGSWLASGKNPASDTYTITFQTELAGITGFRLETLPDDSLPANGPGRVAHGNFVLNEVRVETSPNGKKFQAVPLSQATADWEQGGKEKPEWPAAGAIDGNPKTGWAVAQEYGKPHAIVLETKADVGAADKPTTVRVTLEQNYGSQHTIGRFRLSTTTNPRPVIHDSMPDDVANILAIASAERNEKQTQKLLDWYAGIDPGLSKLRDQLAALKKKAPKSPYMSVHVIAQRTNNPRTTHVLGRGDFLQPGTEVGPGVLATLHDLQLRGEDAPADRLDLARWLVSPDNPLTPRVAVNHIWKYLFGQGLVRTMNDFGVRGEKPTHPELLDWLASEYIRLGWSRKELINTIVMSSTYRQASRHRPELAETDPNNRLLARQNRFRVEAETVRDVSLAAAGLLSRKIGGPSVFPPMPADVAALSYANNFKWNTSTGEDRYRRGMYTFFKRTAPHPNLTTFDCPDANTTKVERDRSNTPLQALTMLNNDVFIEASQALARRVLQQQLPGDRERLVAAFRLCVARPPAETELVQFRELLEASREWYAAHPEDAKQLIGSYDMDTVAPPEVAAWVATARVLLNMDEFITRE